MSMTLEEAISRAREEADKRKTEAKKLTSVGASDNLISALSMGAEMFNVILARLAELEAGCYADCPHIRPYMVAVDDVESFDFWPKRASTAELRCAVALQRGEIDRLRLEPMRAAADTLRAMAEQHRIKNTCNGHWCASNAGEANRLLWVALLETADAMESKNESK